MFPAGNRLPFRDHLIVQSPHRPLQNAYNGKHIVAARKLTPALKYNKCVLMRVVTHTNLPGDCPAKPPPGAVCDERPASC